MSMSLDHTRPTNIRRAGAWARRPVRLLLLCAVLPLQHACTCISFADPTWDRRHPDVFDVPTDDGEDQEDGEAQADIDPWVEAQCYDFCSGLQSTCEPGLDEWMCQARCVGSTEDDRQCRLDRLREAELLAGDARAEACRMAAGDETCVDPCNLYCDTVQAFCRGSEAVFPDEAACLERCADWYREEAPWCAIEHARAAELDPEAECRRADEGGCLCWSRGVADGCLPESTACDTPLDLLDHCGACGVACADDERCVRESDVPPLAACRPACTDGLRCDETCVDPRTDPARCGATSCADGTTCAPGEVCDGTGRCSAGCAPGFDDCGRCVDLDRDPLHCGACDRACGPRQRCAGGSCACDGLAADCNGVADDGCEVRLDDDPANCGACGVACAAGESCTAGHCLSATAVVAAGDYHTCAVRAGVVWCWGLNDCGGAGCGMLGTGDTEPRLRPSAVPGLPAAISVTAASFHTCALLEDGTARCWGSAGSGRLGPVPTTSTVVPVEVPLPPLAELDAGGARTCARTAAGGVLCWGQNLVSGGLHWSASSEPLPIDFPEPETLSLGAYRVCAVSGGRVWCFGTTGDGLLGAGTAHEELLVNVARIVGLPETVEVAAGGLFACARSAAGEIWCWGANEEGQAGPGPESLPEPQLVTLERPAVRVAAGYDATCAVLDTGELRCWGAAGGWAGGAPYAVDLPGPVTSVAVGGRHVCAATLDGEVHCWGQNHEGQLGDGTTTSRLTPGAVVFE